MSACAACGAASPSRALLAQCGHAFCGRCGATRAASGAPCPACGDPLRMLDAGTAAEAVGCEARRVRYRSTELRLDVRTAAGETTHERVAALLDVPRDRLTLLAAGRKLHSEADARVARAILAVGTPVGAQLPRVPLWRRVQRWASALLVPAAARAAPSAFMLWRCARSIVSVTWLLFVSLLNPTAAPPLGPPAAEHEE